MKLYKIIENGQLVGSIKTNYLPEELGRIYEETTEEFMNNWHAQISEINRKLEPGEITEEVYYSELNRLKQHDVPKDSELRRGL